MTRHRFFHTAFLSVLILAVTFIVRGYAGTSGTDLEEISFQGRLTDSTGKPYNGNQSVVFKIQKDNVDIWTETHSSVPFVNGVFSVTLGSTNPLTAQNVGSGTGHVFAGTNSETYEVVVTVGGETFELPIKRAPSAMNAAFLNGLDCDHFVQKTDYSSKGAIVAGSGVNNYSTLAVGTDGQVLVADSSQTTGLSWEDRRKVIQHQEYTTGSVASSSSTIPYDDSIPQNTEGYAFMTLSSFVPKKSSSRILVQVVFNGSHNHPYGWAQTWTVALFKNSETSAMAATCMSKNNNFMGQSVLTHSFSSPGSSFSLTVRAGAETNSPSASLTMNGVGGSRRMGGELISSIHVYEID